MFNKNISIIGGCGHIGFPLGLAFSEKKYNVNLIDKNLININLINNGICPYKEEKSKKILKKNLKKRIFAYSDFNKIKSSKYIIVCIGTPINKKLKPDTSNFILFFKKLKKFINKEQIIIIRSSIYPNISKKVFEILKDKNTNLSYCPERVVQGKLLTEVKGLTQVISGYNKLSITESAKLFKKIYKKVIVTEVLEAELIKLFSNAYRYMHFAIANQFFMICKKHNINFNKLRKNMIDGYQRNASLPSAGFTSGPCLLKDTMQLYSFTKNTFKLGFASMKINEKLPFFLIENLKNTIDFKKKVIGVLGLTFKSESDDIRDSLSIKLINYLKKEKINFLCSDEYFKNKFTVSTKYLVNKSDIIIIATPHKNYKKLKFPKSKILIDIWNIKKVTSI